MLKSLSQNQDKLQAYFKGGTAVYKILNTMNRFSEDIDLTVKILSEQSNTKNKNRLKQSALGYKIQGLELSKEDTIDHKGSITVIYKYDSIYNMNELHRAGIIQVEATSFTVSEPYQNYSIEPLIYSLCSASEKKIIEKEFDISAFNINIIKLTRIFIDKVFAAEFYYLRKMYKDASKHLYDLAVLFDDINIQNLLNDKSELEKLINYKRQEEKNRIGGISNETRIKDFSYFQLNFDEKLIEEFNNMQHKYVLNEKYKINIAELKEITARIHEYFLEL